MFDVQGLIYERRYRARRNQSQARWFLLIGGFLLYVATPLMLVGGLIHGGLDYEPARDPRDFLHFGLILSRIANGLHGWIEGYLGVFWDIIVSIAPSPHYPTTGTPEAMMAALFGWAAWIWSLPLFGRHLLNLSRKRRASAERIEEKLEDAQPTLMDIHDRQQQRQNNQVRDVTGDHNTIQGCVISPAANSNRSSSCSGMCRSKRRSAISDANSDCGSR